MIATPFFRTPTHELFLHRRIFTFLVCTRIFQFVNSHVFCSRYLVRIGFQSVISYSSVFCVPVTLYSRVFKNPSARTHQFSVHPSARTHEFSENPSARTHAFTVCALTNYTPPFVISGSCPSPNLKKDFFARIVSTPFSDTTYTQDRFRHVHHMEIVPFRLTANFQRDLSLSVFIERFSVYSSETCYTIRLFYSGVSKPLGTHVDRGSAVDHHQTFMGSWVPVPGCFFLFSILFNSQPLWLKFNLSRFGIGVLNRNFVHHLVVICS